MKISLSTFKTATAAYDGEPHRQNAPHGLTEGPATIRRADLVAILAQIIDLDLFAGELTFGGLDAAQASEKGLVIRRALDLMCALKLGVRISLDEIRADELATMLIIAEERDLLEREKSP